jgi:hypothetical protein
MSSASGSRVVRGRRATHHHVHDRRACGPPHARAAGNCPLGNHSRGHRVGRRRLCRASAGRTPSLPPMGRRYSSRSCRRSSGCGRYLNSSPGHRRTPSRRRHRCCGRESLCRWVLLQARDRRCGKKSTPTWHTGPSSGSAAPRRMGSRPSQQDRPTGDQRGVPRFVAETVRAFPASEPADQTLFRPLHTSSHAARLGGVSGGERRCRPPACVAATE